MYKHLGLAASVVVCVFIAVGSESRADDDTLSSSHFQASCRQLAYDISPGAIGANLSTSFDDGECVGFLTGAWEAIDIYQSVFKQREICLPASEVTKKQTALIWLKYLDNHPEELHFPAALTFVEALLSVFPCTDTRTSSVEKAPSAQASNDSPKQFGTGFFVSSDGMLLTNAHVVRQCTRYAVREATGTWEPAALIAYNDVSDLALLQTATHRAPASAIFRNGSAELGESVLVFGYPLPGLLASSGNVTLGNVTATAGPGDDQKLIQLSAPVQPGNSGGSVLDADGNVIGIVVGKLDAEKVASIIDDIPQNVNFAIKSSVAVNFLEAHTVPYNAGNLSGRPLATRELTNSAKQFTVQVSCG